MYLPVDGYLDCFYIFLIINKPFLTFGTKCKKIQYQLFDILVIFRIFMLYIILIIYLICLNIY